MPTLCGRTRRWLVFSVPASDGLLARRRTAQPQIFDGTAESEVVEVLPIVAS